MTQRLLRPLSSSGAVRLKPPWASPGSLPSLCLSTLDSEEDVGPGGQTPTAAAGAQSTFQVAVLPVVPSPQLQPASAPVVQRAWRLKKNARGCEPVQFKPTLFRGQPCLIADARPCGMAHLLACPDLSAVHSHTIATSGRWPPAAPHCVWGPHWCWTCLLTGVYPGWVSGRPAPWAPGP